MAGVEVAPGQRTIIDLPITDLSTHTPMSMPVQIVNGRSAGPHLFVSAALHGDEINGVEIIRRLLKLRALSGMRGALLAIPIVNTFGFVSLSRYLPDRRDLNRTFPGSPHGSMAARLADTFLNEIVTKCSHGIDLHTGAIHRANFPQVRANLDDGEALRLAEAFSVPIIINTGYREGSLREAAAAKDVSVIVYEAGEALRFDEICIRAGVNGITRAMRALGMLPPTRRRGRPMRSAVLRSTTWIRAPRSGVFRAAIGLGESVLKGDHLGVISDPFGENEEALDARVGGIVIGRTNLPLVYAGDALFHIGRPEGTQAAARSLDAFEPEAEYESGLTAELASEPPIV